MRLINLTPFPIRIGSAVAPEIPSSGAPHAVVQPGAVVELIEFDGLGEIQCESAGRVSDVTGWPSLDASDDEPTPAIVIPLAVASALRELGRKAPTGGPVFTPGMLREEGGVKFAPHLIRHRDLEMVFRG